MKYKIMGIFSLIFVVALTLAAASAADNNATDEIVSMENTHNEYEVNVEQSNDDGAVENDSNQKSEAHTNDVLGASCENEVVLKSASETPVLASAVTAPVKLTASQTEPILKKSSIYKIFKGKSKYTWKIKKTTWNKMKKQAIKQYKSFRSYGSFHPGYSKGISVVVKKGGHKYMGTAFAVKNSRGIRCEVRGLPHGIRASNWGDY